MIHTASIFGRRASSAAAEVTPQTRSDINRFFTAFAGGFVFFSILIL